MLERQNIAECKRADKLLVGQSTKGKFKITLLDFSKQTSKMARIILGDFNANQFANDLSLASLFRLVQRE